MKLWTRGIVAGAVIGLTAWQDLPARAEQAPADFTFKRIKVGEGSGLPGRRLVQIDPEEQARILSANPAVPIVPDTPFDPGPLPETAVPDDAGPSPAPTPREAAYAWYWSHVSANIAAKSAGRLEKAEAALRLGPDGSTVKAPRLSTLQGIADDHGVEILKATIGTEVSPALVLAVIGIESSGRTQAISHAGATGLMQLMPATAERFGVTDRTDPAQNIKGGVAYLDWLLGEFGKDPVLALAGYNAGEGAVKRHGGVPPYSETRDYVPKVLAAWTVAKGLCLTPPQLISDGCVFRRSVASAGSAVSDEG